MDMLTKFFTAAFQFFHRPTTEAAKTVALEQDRAALAKMGSSA
jgi:hypothetical protein